MKKGSKCKNIKSITSLEQLKEWEFNPREIDTRALTGLKTSLFEFGDLSGIVWNTRLNALVCGHQRTKAITEMWGDRVKIEDNVIILPNGERFAIRVVDWDFQKHTAANIAANNQFVGGTFTDGLAGLMNGLERSMPEMFQGLNFDRLKIEFEEFWKTQEITEDVAPPLPKKSKTKAGDLYELGDHRLLCGDSTKAEDWAKLMDGKKANLVFTDAPYNVDYESSTGRSYDSTLYGGNGSKIFNDNKSDEDCVEFYTSVLKNLAEVTTDNATIYWWLAGLKQHLNRQAFVNAGWHLSQLVIWLKNSFVFAMGQEYHRAYEPCMVGWKKGKKHFSTKMFNNMSDVFSLDFADFQEQLNVWYERRDLTNNYVHPTQKPVRLAERALKKNSRIGDIVVDAFGGSGSTLIGCHQMNRKGYLIELDPKFCDVIVTRYCNFTSNTAIKLNGKSITWKSK